MYEKGFGFFVVVFFSKDSQVLVVWRNCPPARADRLDHRGSPQTKPTLVFFNSCSVDAVFLDVKRKCCLQCLDTDILLHNLM